MLSLYLDAFLDMGPSKFKKRTMLSDMTRVCVCHLYMAQVAGHLAHLHAKSVGGIIFGLGASVPFCGYPKRWQVLSPLLSGCDITSGSCHGGLLYWGM